MQSLTVALSALLVFEFAPSRLVVFFTPLDPPSSLFPCRPRLEKAFCPVSILVLRTFTRQSSQGHERGIDLHELAVRLRLCW